MPSTLENTAVLAQTTEKHINAPRFFHSLKACVSSENNKI